MDNGHELRPAIPECFPDLRRLDDLAPGRFDLDHTRPATFGHIHHPAAEDTIHADDDLITGFDEVHKAKLHAGAAGATHRESHFVFGQKHLAEHGFDLIHHLDEYRIKVPQERCGHGFEDTRRDIAWARAHKQTFGRLKSGYSLHAKKLTSKPSPEQLK